MPTKTDKPDLRIQRTKDAIREAFKALVIELPFEKITVKAIAGRTRINRNTFYLHYETVDDLLRKIPKEKMIELASTLLEKGIDGFLETRK